MWLKGQEAIHGKLGSQDVTYLSLHPIPLPPRYRSKVASRHFAHHWIRGTVYEERRYEVWDTSMGINNSKNIDSLLLLVLIFVMNHFDKCIILCLSYSIFFDKFIRLKINVSVILNKSLLKDFYAMFLTVIEFATIIASLRLRV
jgi:hypothetical protein